MSLINNMLKDLEKRQIQLEKPYLSAIYSRKQKRKINLSSYYIIPCIILLACFLFLLVYCIVKPVVPLQHIKSLPTDSFQHTPILNMSDENTWIKHGSITGITTQLKDNITEMTFSLDHPILYRLVTNEMNNEIEIIFDNTELQAAIPSLNQFVTAIQYLRAEQDKHETIFHLRLSPGATIQYINLSNEDHDPELVLAIASPLMNPLVNPAVSPHTTPANIIKTPAIQTVLSEQYQLALNDIEKNNYEAAILRLNALLKTDPSYKDARTSLVALYLNNGEQREAEKMINEGMQLSSNYAPFIELKARILDLKGKTQQALDLLHTISPPINENPDYHALIAALYEQHNDDALAIDTYKQLININPHNGNWWFGLAVSYEKTNQNKAAMTAYKRAMAEGQLNPDSNQYLQTHLQALQRSLHEVG